MASQEGPCSVEFVKLYNFECKVLNSITIWRKGRHLRSRWRRVMLW